MRLRLFPTVNAPGEARRALAPFDSAIDRESLSGLRTVVNELITVSVLHGASQPVDIWVELVGREIEGRVDDHGPGIRAIARARENRDDAFMLRIIDGFVDEWTVSEDGVWFRMSASPLVL